MITKEDIGKEREIVCSLYKIKKPYLKIKSAKFECPSCGSVITVLQLEEKFREPTRCSCGRRGGFKVISKEVVEAQEIILMEKETCFEFKAYFEGKKIVDKIKLMQDKKEGTNFVTVTGIIEGEYKKNTTKGDFVIYVKKLEKKEEKKPAFLN